MKVRFSSVAALLLGSSMLMSASAAYAADAKRCSIAWSHYTGWEPLGWIQDSGVAKKWGDKYKVNLSITLINDYVESVNQYSAGQFDGVAVANMDALTTPAKNGVDTTILVVGDFSNGNDGILIVAPKGATMKDLKGKEMKLVELSVSHYLLARALEMNGMSERDLKKTIHASDAEMGNLIATASEGSAFTMWNPQLQAARELKNVRLLFDSSKIPGEIIDTIAVSTKASDGCKKAVTGAWYEAMRMMSGAGPESVKMIQSLASQAGGSEDQFRAQLRTTRMFYEPSEAVTFVEGAQVKKTMEFVAKFTAEHGIFGPDVTDPKTVGIQYPDGTVWGNKENVKLRFDSTYMRLAAEGKL